MHKVQMNSSSFDPESVKKRISHFDEFDNGHVLFSYSKMSVADSEEKAKQASIKHPDDVYYVSYDDLMNACSDTYWFQGVAYDNAGAWEALRNYRKSKAGLNSGRGPLNSSEEQVKVSGIVTIYSDFVDFKRSVSEHLLQTAVGDRAKLKFKWVGDNKVEVKAICSVADERKVKIFLEDSDVTKTITWNTSANSSRLNSSVGPCFATLWSAYIDDEYKCACCGKHFPAGHNSVHLSGHKPDGMHFIFEYTKENREGNSVNYDPYNLPKEDPEGGIFKVVVGEDADDEGYHWLNFCRNCWPKHTSMSPEEIYAKYSPDAKAGGLNSNKGGKSMRKVNVGKTPGKKLNCSNPLKISPANAVRKAIPQVDLPEGYHFSAPRRIENGVVVTLVYEADGSQTWAGKFQVLNDYGYWYCNDYMDDYGDEYGTPNGDEPDNRILTAEAAAYWVASALQRAVDTTLENLPDRVVRLMNETSANSSCKSAQKSTRKKLNSSSSSPLYLSYYDMVDTADKAGAALNLDYSDVEAINDLVAETEANYGKVIGFLIPKSEYFDALDENDLSLLFVLDNGDIGKQYGDRFYDVDEELEELIDMELLPNLNSSRKRMSSSRRKKLNSSKKSEIMELTGWSPDDLADAFDEWLANGGDEYEEDEQFDAFADAVAEAAELGDTDAFGIPLKASRKMNSSRKEGNNCMRKVIFRGKLNSSRKRMNSSRRKLNSSEDDITADDDIQDTGIDGGDTATETAELLDDALIVQNPETKEVSLFVATEDDEVLPESVDVIAEVTPVVEGAVLDSSRRLKRFAASKLNSSKGCLNSDSEDVCPACGNPVSECTCEPGTVAYDEIQLPDDTVVEVENILVVQDDKGELGLFMPEDAEEAVPEGYEVVATATPAAEADVLDSSRRMKKSNAKKLNSSAKKNG